MKKGVMIFLVLLLFSLSVFAANLGVPCAEKYGTFCTGSCCNCVNICGVDYECGADDGVSPPFFFSGKGCCTQDPDSCDLGETLIDGKCVIIEPEPECNNNGIAETGEVCDGSDLRGRTCSDFYEVSAGALSCTETCEYDLSGCEGYVCDNDGIAETGEICDGTSLRGLSCSDVGPFVGGRLLCNDCMHDTSLCVTDQQVGECKYNGICDPLEGCMCEDCFGEQSSCVGGAVCNVDPDTGVGSCRCTEGTTYCSSTHSCVTSSDQCPDFECPSTCNPSASQGERALFSCLCDVCNQMQGPCTSAASCSEGVCRNCDLITIGWEQICAENGHIANVIVGGDSFCEGKTLQVSVNDVDYWVKEGGYTSFNNSEAYYGWVASWFDTGTILNDNPEYLVVASLSGVTSIESPEDKDSLLTVQPCNVEQDEDCDEVCDPGVICDDGECCDEDGQCCEDNDGQGDMCPSTPACADVSKNGCTSTQSSCFAEWDCTPGNPFDNSGGALEWSECYEFENRLVRQRLVCPDPEGECCTDQSNCYCKMPAVGSKCAGFFMRPAMERSCIQEAEFPVFTLSNVIITIFLLAVYFMFVRKNEN